MSAKDDQQFVGQLRLHFLRNPQVGAVQHLKLRWLGGPKKDQLSCEIPELNRGSNRKIRHKWWIFHCHVCRRLAESSWWFCARFPGRSGQRWANRCLQLQGARRTFHHAKCWPRKGETSRNSFTLWESQNLLWTYVFLCQIPTVLVCDTKPIFQKNIFRGFRFQCAFIQFWEWGAGRPRTKSHRTFGQLQVIPSGNLT